MAEDDVRALNDRLIDEDALRSQFVRDPVGVVNAAGIETTPEQEERLLGEGWLDKTEDEVLAALRETGLAFWL